MWVQAITQFTICNRPMMPIKDIWLVRKLGNTFLSLNHWLWKRLPPWLLRTRPLQQYGRLLHKLILIRGWRRHQSVHTYMLRNRPEMDMIHDLALQHKAESPLRIAVVACSFGMEVYSIKWALRDLDSLCRVSLVGIDIDKSVLQIARRGRYPLNEFSWQFDMLTSEEHQEICPTVGNTALVNETLRSGVRWLHADANDPELVDKIGLQDIVVANRFLCHMQPEKAVRCLRTVTRLVCPGGYLFITGVDLDVRQSVMQETGFRPVVKNLEKIHYGDPSLFPGWPWEYWSLEPMDKRRPDWVERYAMVYQKPVAV